MSKQTKGIILAIAGASLWGGSGAAVQYLFTDTNLKTEWIVAIRMLFAGLMLLIWSVGKQRSQLVMILHDHVSWWKIILFALLGVTNSQLSYFFAVKYSNAPTATVLQYLSPILIIIWMAIVTKRWPRRIDLISIGLALVGTFYLVTGGNIHSLMLTHQALAWGLWSAVAAALYTLLPRQLMQKYDASVMCGVAMFIGGIILSPILFIEAGPQLNILDWLLVAYVVIFGTALAYTLFVQSIRYVSPSVTGILSAFEPLVATILAVTLLGTRLTFATTLGSLLIVATTLIQSIPTNPLAKRK
ncbi:Drug/metabolite exporter family protein [Limosilactobacillus gastricus PS3]|uniref:Drug/metabolite exporter family protein n=1 Tax=Limosilactobacillus gastricus PS3 TaxID=1144300 RepID=H4GJE1_9LACO|nr:EamA family transporter [Limosilactobacillus gastricus]EHS86890.1 Drug/metabolite exporter family protein [Limosilactobacillus gastricus PS3]